MALWFLPKIMLTVDTLVSSPTIFIQRVGNSKIQYEGEQGFFFS